MATEWSWWKKYSLHVGLLFLSARASNASEATDAAEFSMSYIEGKIWQSASTEFQELFVSVVHVSSPGSRKASRAEMN